MSEVFPKYYHFPRKLIYIYIIVEPGLYFHCNKISLFSISFFQEIDGKAFLLLNSDMMMKYMGLKLGPALKICNLVSRLKGRRHAH